MIGNFAIAELGSRRYWSIHGVGLAIVLALSFQTWRQLRIWAVDKREPRHILAVQQRLAQRASIPWANRGEKRVKKGLTEGAIEDYLQALKFYPAHAEVHNNLGLLLAIRGHLDEAAGHYRAALRAKPEYALAYKNLGDVLLLQGKVDEAIASYRRALELDPDLISARARLDNAVHRVDKRDPRQILADQLQSMYTVSARWAKRGDTLAQRGDVDSALEAYEKALTLYPMYPEVHNNVGLLLASRGRFGEAIEHLQEALRLNPEFPLAYTNLGDVLLFQGKNDEAIEHFRRALELDPKLTSARRSLEKALRVNEPQATPRVNTDVGQ